MLANWRSSPLRAGISVIRTRWRRTKLFTVQVNTKNSWGTICKATERILHLIASLLSDCTFPFKAHHYNSSTTALLHDFSSQVWHYHPLAQLPQTPTRSISTLQTTRQSVINMVRILVHMTHRKDTSHCKPVCKAEWTCENKWYGWKSQRYKDLHLKSYKRHVLCVTEFCTVPKKLPTLQK